MATQLEPQFGREVLRCDACLLVQFPTRACVCRRCGLAYDASPEAVRNHIEAVRERMECEEIVLPVGPVIRAVRQARGMTQAQLASQLGTCRERIAWIETEARSVRLDVLAEIGRVLRAPAGALVQMAVIAQGARG